MISAMSPFKQRAVHNLFRSYIFNGYRRLSSQAVYWVIPFALGTYCTLIFTSVIVYLSSLVVSDIPLQATAPTRGPSATTHGKTARQRMSQVTAPTELSRACVHTWTHLIFNRAGA